MSLMDRMALVSHKRPRMPPFVETPSDLLSLARRCSPTLVALLYLEARWRLQGNNKLSLTGLNSSLASYFQNLRNGTHE